jgi:glycosyltransferase involved in cell wall biosynthesis
MKIAQIAPPWMAIPPKNYGGTENVIYNLVEELVALGHDVTLLAPGDSHTSAQLVAFIPTSLKEEGVPWDANLKAYYHLHKSFEYVAQHHFDIVHMHLSSTADMYLFPLSSTLSIPHVTTLHSHFPFDKGPNNWLGDADQHYMEWSEQVRLVAISESARKQQKMPVRFVGVVHHGIDASLYIPPSDIVPGNHFVWLGSFVPTKGPHLAIEAARRTGAPLVLAGIKNTQDPEVMAYFDQKIEPYIDGNQIRYIGPVNMEQKVALLSSARALLNPIDWEEPFGMVMIEAMATGCPVISFARGAAPEIIAHGKSGFLASTLDEMTQYMDRIDEIDRATVHQYVQRHFSSRVMAESYVRIYQKIVAMKAFSQPVPSFRRGGNDVLSA